MPLALDQAYQTGSRQAACGPIACSMRPIMTFLISYMTENYSKLYEFTVISSIKQFSYSTIGVVLLLFSTKV